MVLQLKICLYAIYLLSQLKVVLHECLHGFVDALCVILPFLVLQQQPLAVGCLFAQLLPQAHHFCFLSLQQVNYFCMLHPEAPVLPPKILDYCHQSHFFLLKGVYLGVLAEDDAFLLPDAECKAGQFFLSFL